MSRLSVIKKKITIIINVLQVMVKIFFIFILTKIINRVIKIVNEIIIELKNSIIVKFEGREEIVKLLLNENKDVNNKNNSVLGRNAIFANGVIKQIGISKASSFKILLMQMLIYRYL